LPASTAARYRASLSPRALDDLESITGELVANALEHGDGHTITVVCFLHRRDSRDQRDRRR
jgi:anti-sigma regulatory factor (Ser/Thr protein kinase)